MSVDEDNQESDSRDPGCCFASQEKGVLLASSITSDNTWLPGLEGQHGDVLMFLVMILNSQGVVMCSSCFRTNHLSSVNVEHP